MSPLGRGFSGALALSIVLLACQDPSEPLGPAGSPEKQKPSFTPASGSASTLLGRATFGEGTDNMLKIKRQTGDWQIDIKAKPAFDLAVQRIVFQRGAQSGWHTHPGPVFIQVVQGTMTFYMSDDPACAPMVRTAGQGYLDLGEHPHIARNESADSATNIVTYFAPPGATLRIDEPLPGNCPF